MAIQRVIAMRSPTTIGYLLAALLLPAVLVGTGVSQSSHLFHAYRDIVQDDAPVPRIQTLSNNNSSSNISNNATASPVPTIIAVPVVGQLARTGSFANCTHHRTQVPATRTMNHEDSFYDGTFIASCHELHYRAPIEAMKHQHQRHAPTIVFGVLSGPGEAQARATVRRTWALNLDPGTVFFIVAGPWRDVSNEYEEKNDIVWVDMVDHFSQLTYKTAAMMVVFRRHIQSFKYVFKTDTDTFINTRELRKDLLQTKRPGDYYGYRHGFYQARSLVAQYPALTFEYPEDLVPHYMIGPGYGLSRRFVDCALRHLATIRFHPLEDVYTGLLGERCGVTCRDTQNTVQMKWRWDVRGEVRQSNMTGYLLSHKVTNASTMHSMWNSLYSDGEGM